MLEFPVTEYRRPASRLLAGDKEGGPAAKILFKTKPTPAYRTCQVGFLTK